jgi:hypothetical protein
MPPHGSRDSGLSGVHWHMALHDFDPSVVRSLRKGGRFTGPCSLRRCPGVRLRAAPSAGKWGGGSVFIGVIPENAAACSRRAEWSRSRDRKRAVALVVIVGIRRLPPSGVGACGRSHPRRVLSHRGRQALDPARPSPGLPTLRATSSGSGVLVICLDGSGPGSAFQRSLSELVRASGRGRSQPRARASIGAAGWAGSAGWRLSEEG